MANINVSTSINAPEEIQINLVREDYLKTSNNYRIFFEICLAIAGAILGNIISYSKIVEIPVINWIFFILMLAGCITFAILSQKNYKKAKSHQIEE